MGRQALGDAPHPGRADPLVAVLAGSLAALVPLKNLAELVNIGTLFAFVIVNVGVIVLRHTKPDLERGFRVPFVPVFPLIGGALCGRHLLPVRTVVLTAPLGRGLTFRGPWPLTRP